MKVPIRSLSTSCNYLRHKICTASFNGVFLTICAVVLLGVNYTLFQGEIRTELIFFPDAVLAGKWWLIFTHPLVHLSWYHLMLDGLAFMLLFAILEESSIWLKLLYIISTGLGALAFALLMEPYLGVRGLSGLSGIAHGLMAVAALEMLRRKEIRRLGLLSLGALGLKCIYELLSQESFLESLHLGSVGEPLVSCHAGGVIGGVLTYGVVLTLHLLRQHKDNNCVGICTFREKGTELQQ